MGFDDVAALLAGYTRDMAVIEFVPPEDSIVSKWLQESSSEFIERYKWYNKENFKSALARHFATIEEHESHPATRTIFFCRKGSGTPTAL
jgi:hypothetical protein